MHWNTVLTRLNAPKLPLKAFQNMGTFCKSWRSGINIKPIHLEIISSAWPTFPPTYGITYVKWFFFLKKKTYYLSSSHVRMWTRKQTPLPPDNYLPGRSPIVFCAIKQCSNIGFIPPSNINNKDTCRWKRNKGWSVGIMTFGLSSETEW